VKRRTKILIVFGLVILFAAAFALISTSPRRRIPPGSIVLLDRSPGEPVSWMLLSNATTRAHTIYVGFTVSPTVSLESVPPLMPKGNLLIEPRAAGRLSIRHPSFRGAMDLQIITGEELKSPERLWLSAQMWMVRFWRTGTVRTLGWKPVRNSDRYGHWTDITPELLNSGTNRLVETHK
jgi:hypothetical protein